MDQVNQYINNNANLKLNLHVINKIVEKEDNDFIGCG